MHIGDRLPDTTMGDELARLDAGSLRGLLYSQIRRAHRAKQLQHDFPLRVASLDGKCTTSILFDKPEAKTRYGQLDTARGTVKITTVTACLITTPARPRRRSRL